MQIGEPVKTVEVPIRPPLPQKEPDPIKIDNWPGSKPETVEPLPAEWPKPAKKETEVPA